MQEDNKRLRPRFDFSYSVMCFKKIEKNSFKDTLFVLRLQVNDISYGGIGISCDKKIESGDILVFNIVIQENYRLEFKAEVKWVKYSEGSYQAGLEFVEMRRENIYLIRDILKLIKDRKR